MLHYFVLEIIFLLIAFFVAGINGLVFVLFHSFVSITLLELGELYSTLWFREKNGEWKIREIY